MAKQVQIEIRHSEHDDPARAAALPMRRRSSWRGVLDRLPATGTRVDVKTGARLGTARGTGEISERV